MAAARTRLVLVVDVDCVMATGSCEALVGSPDKAAALLRLCLEGDAVVVPALELCGGGSLCDGLTVHQAKQMLQDGSMQPFMHSRYAAQY